MILEDWQGPQYLDGAFVKVNGNILCKEVTVTVTSTEWWDKVFESNYSLMSISELEKYINTNKHLPDIPNTCEVSSNGLTLGEFNGLLLKKVEELTLYIISLQNQILELKDFINEK